MGASVSTGYQSSVTDINQILTSITCSNDSQINRIENVSISFKDTDCNDITVASQTNAFTCESQLNAAIDTTVQSLVELRNSSKRSGPLDFSSPLDAVANLFSVQVTLDYKVDETNVQSAVKAVCGSQSSTKNEAVNVSISMEGVACDQVRILNQNLSNNIACVQSFYEHTVAANGLTSELSGGKRPYVVRELLKYKWEIVGGIAVLLLIIIIAAVAHHHRGGT